MTETIAYFDENEEGSSMIEYIYMSHERPRFQSLDAILASLDGSIKREKFSIMIKSKLCEVVKKDSTAWTVYIEDRALAVTLHTDNKYRVLDHSSGDAFDPTTTSILSPLAIEAVKQSISSPQK